jgi:hypothetical protein
VPGRENSGVLDVTDTVSENEGGHTERVPRISSATLAEHRVAQRAALLRAAAELVISGGAAAVNPTAVADRAGIARTSVYDYFHSREDLLVTSPPH